MSVYVVRAFIQMREQLAANRDILKRLAEIDKTLLEHDSVLRDIYRKLLPSDSKSPDSFYGRGRKDEGAIEPSAISKSAI